MYFKNTAEFRIVETTDICQAGNKQQNNLFSVNGYCLVRGKVTWNAESTHGCKTLGQPAFVYVFPVTNIYIIKTNN